MKNKTKVVYLQAPKGVRVKRHEFEDGEVRFTIRQSGYRALVGWFKSGKFLWIKNGFSA